MLMLWGHELDLWWGSGVEVGGGGVVKAAGVVSREPDVDGQAPSVFRAYGGPRADRPSPAKQLVNGPIRPRN